MNPLKPHKRGMKASVARATGIPTTKSGRSRKADRIQNQAIGWLVLIGIVVYLFSGGSEAGSDLDQSLPSINLEPQQESRICGVRWVIP